MTTASICTIGDEILIGQVVDTNSSHISQALNSLGIKVSRMVSIGDDHDTIVKSLSDELLRNDIVIVTGGLGPTKDDITKKALADLSGAASYRAAANGDPTCLDIFHEPRMHAFGGLLTMILQSGENQGDAILKVRGKNLQQAVIKLSVK